MVSIPDLCPLPYFEKKISSPNERVNEIMLHVQFSSIFDLLLYAFVSTVQ